MNDPLWRLIEVTVPGRHAPRLDHISLEIPRGITAVLGPSGAGKTTLLSVLVGFERPASGTVVRTLAITGNRLPVFWSPPGHGLWPHLTVAAHVTSLLTGPETHCRQAADKLLHAFDLASLHRAFPGTLSQGERDRLSLARALASQAQVLVLDEPLIHVQPKKGRSYWEFVRDWCQNTETSIVLATHDSQLGHCGANHVIDLDLGRVVRVGSVDESESLANP